MMIERHTCCRRSRHSEGYSQLSTVLRLPRSMMLTVPLRKLGEQEHVCYLLGRSSVKVDGEQVRA
jgi:hypothetical protein